MQPSTVLALSAAGTASYSAQMLVAPETFSKVYMTDQAPTQKTKTAWRWFGHALMGSAVGAALAVKNKEVTKAVLYGQAAQWGTAPMLMAAQARSGAMKNEMAIANGAFCLGMAALTVKAAGDLK
mmetsp:Transcript_12574/g.41459  ORF Transcript_12574/g.41459 Transcript_12574/m.41459 type:complete len:125 (-) Transcript_12574:103-477(-)|eukprot:CAMPEP_0170143798 /NCGR_PEP_ID=MMETSP0033_2-20121228/13115_1 /TAXON_ID=195969 /ORGANISM="Dolichomastix tenuilepis, Strain CCMP3274" /LENGTH=124 /DNA_ID=CAMNT_0010380269 /DNA_START=44 /DNA_END=418 /DNA_ORIENTATION=+